MDDKTRQQRITAYEFYQWAQENHGIELVDSNDFDWDVAADEYFGENFGKTTEGSEEYYAVNEALTNFNYYPGIKYNDVLKIFLQPVGSSTLAGIYKTADNRFYTGVSYYGKNDLSYILQYLETDENDRTVAELVKLRVSGLNAAQEMIEQIVWAETDGVRKATKFVVLTIQRSGFGIPIAVADSIEKANEIISRERGLNNKDPINRPFSFGYDIVETNYER